MHDDKPWLNKPARTIRHGHFWVPGDGVMNNGRTYQRGPMFVEWEAPDAVTKPYPIVLVHGAGLQGSEWFGTPEGRPGWAQRFVEQGYVVLVVDRPGYGRSSFHADTMGAVEPATSSKNGGGIYLPANASASHTLSPSAIKDDEAVDNFIAGYDPLPADLAASQDIDADCLARLIDRIGPSILFTHSASAPSGWLTADRRPGQVIAIVAVEPMGPPFADIPNLGSLTWGLAAAPLTFAIPGLAPDDVRSAPIFLRIPAIDALPILIVTADASTFAAAGMSILQHLRASGAAAELLHLPDHEVYGNGHRVIDQLNSDEALRPIITWLNGTLLSNGD